MLRPWLRGALLLVAAWALLFAPGALEGTAAAGGEVADVVAAAVAAPTFSPDAVAPGRHPAASRSDDRDLDRVDVRVAAPVTAGVGDGTDDASMPADGSTPAVPGARWSQLRAPPAV